MEQKKFICILSIDGGGIRGILPGQVLASLEAILNKKEEEKGNPNPEARIADYFDLVAGTSTGGILTCAYLCPHPTLKDKPKFTAEEVVKLYLDYGEKIFGLPWKQKIKSLFGWSNEKYSATNLYNTLEGYFGDIWLNELLKPCVITSYDIERRHGHFFAQHDAKNDEDYNFKVKDVARSTSAAPTYFECAHIQSLKKVTCNLIDGGVFVNNPTLCAYAEARQLFEIGAKDMFILSLGTGSVKKPYMYNKAKDWGKIGWLRPLIDIMMSGAAEVVHFQIKQIYETVHAKDQYVRIDPKLEDNPNVRPEMDFVKPPNIEVLRQFGLETAQTYQKELEAVADILIQNKK